MKTEIMDKILIPINDWIIKQLNRLIYILKWRLRRKYRKDVKKAYNSSDDDIESLNKAAMKLMGFGCTAEEFKKRMTKRIQS